MCRIQLQLVRLLPMPGLRYEMPQIPTCPSSVLRVWTPSDKQYSSLMAFPRYVYGPSERQSSTYVAVVP